MDDTNTTGVETLRLTEAARRFGVTRARLYRSHHAGNITIFKLGRASLVLADDVRRLVVARPLPRRA